MFSAINPQLKSLHERLNSKILEDNSRPQILRQLLLLPASKVPQGLLKNHEIDYSYPATNDLDKLSLIHKISVLFRTKGPWATRQILEEMDWKPLLKSSPAIIPPMEAIESYSSELSALTDGVMPAYGLNPCRALYMLFYACIDRCEKTLNPSELTDVKEWMYTAFSSFENVLDQDTPYNTHNISNLLQDSIANLKKLRKKRREDCDMMIQIAGLLQKAAAYPIALLPLLKRPLRSNPSDKFLGQDIFNVHFEKSEKWLNDFLASRKGLSTQYMDLLEQTLKKNGKLLEFADKFQQAQKLHREILEKADELQKSLLDLFRRLRPLEKMLASKEVFDGTLVSSFLKELKHLETITVAYHEQMVIPGIEKINAFVKELGQFPEMRHPTIEGLTVKVGFLEAYKSNHMHLPFNCWMGAFFAIHNALCASLNLLKLANEGLEQHIPPELLAMNSPHVTLADLLECQQRAISGDKRIEAHLALIFAEIRRFPRSPDAKDLANRMPLIQEAEKLLQIAKEDPHYNLLKMLSDILKMANGPAWFFRNPYAEAKRTPNLEALYFEKAFLVLIRSFLSVSFPLCQPLEIAFKFPVEEHEKDCAQKMRQVFGKIADQFALWQSKVKTRSIPTFPHHDIVQFIEELRSFMGLVDQEIENAAHQMAEHANPSKGLKAIQQQFSKIKETIQTHFERHFLSFCTPFIRMVEERELLQEVQRTAIRREQATVPKPAAKEKIIPIKPVQPAKVPHAAPPPPPTIESSYQTLRQICSSVLADSKGFKTSPKANKEDLLLLTLQQETAVTLNSLMEDMRELIGSLETHRHKPFYILQLHTRIAILLEQSCKHVAANQKIPISEKEEAHLLTFQEGKECFWKIHAPLKIIQEIEERLKPSPWKLTEAQKSLMARLERVVAISSRYPGSGEDALSASLHQSLCGEKSDLAEALLQQGMDTCIAILKPVVTTSQKLPEPPLQLGQLLAEMATRAAEDEMEALNAIEKALDHLEAFRMPRAHRAVPLIHEWENSAGRRVGTIDTTLRNLKSSSRICRSLLTAELEPSLLATLGATYLLEEAVLLEQMQLSLLALLPHASQQNPDQHFLYDKSLNRYSHSLKQFARELPRALIVQNIIVNDAWLEKIRKRSNDLEPFLKELYRYRKPGMPQLDRLYGLSALRDRIVRGQLHAQEAETFDSLMKIQDPIERLEKLDSHIIEFFNTEIRQPLIEMLWVVAEGLNIHEQLALKQ